MLDKTLFLWYNVLRMKKSHYTTYFKPRQGFVLTSKAKRLMRKRRLVDLLGGKCIDCGYNGHLAALDFDHVDPSTKVSNIGEMLNNPKTMFHEIVAEMDKCVLRCANCHRIKTFPDATM